MKKQPFPQSLLDGYVSLLKTSKTESYRRNVLQQLKQENPQLHAAILKKLGE